MAHVKYTLGRKLSDWLGLERQENHEGPLKIAGSSCEIRIEYTLNVQP